MLLRIVTMPLLVLFKLQVFVHPLAVDLHQQRLADAFAVTRDGQIGDLVVIHDGLNLAKIIQNMLEDIT